MSFWLSFWGLIYEMVRSMRTVVHCAGKGAGDSGCIWLCLQHSDRIPRFSGESKGWFDLPPLHAHPRHPRTTSLGREVRTPAPAKRGVRRRCPIESQNGVRIQFAGEIDPNPPNSKLSKNFQEFQDNMGHLEIPGKRFKSLSILA